jgi:hypothetical protein
MRYCRKTIHEAAPRIKHVAFSNQSVNGYLPPRHEPGLVWLTGLQQADEVLSRKIDSSGP